MANWLDGLARQQENASRNGANYNMLWGRGGVVDQNRAGYGGGAGGGWGGVASAFMSPKAAALFNIAAPALSNIVGGVGDWFSEKVLNRYSERSVANERNRGATHQIGMAADDMETDREVNKGTNTVRRAAGKFQTDKLLAEAKDGKFEYDGVDTRGLRRTASAGKDGAAPQSGDVPDAQAQGSDANPIVKILQILASFLNRDDGDKSNDQEKASFKLDTAYGKDTKEGKLVATLEANAGTAAVVDGKLSEAELRGAFDNLRGKGILSENIAYTVENGEVTISSPLASGSKPGGIESALSDKRGSAR